VDKNNCRGITLPNGKVMKTIDESGYRYLGILEDERSERKGGERPIC